MAVTLSVGIILPSRTNCIHNMADSFYNHYYNSTLTPFLYFGTTVATALLVYQDMFKIHNATFKILM